MASRKKTQKPKSKKKSKKKPEVTFVPAALPTEILYMAIRVPAVPAIALQAVARWANALVDIDNMCHDVLGKDGNWPNKDWVKEVRLAVREALSPLPPTPPPKEEKKKRKGAK